MAYGYILDAARTPRGRGKAGKGALFSIHPQALLAQVLTALPERAGIAPREGFAREELDAVALRSQRNAARAIEEGRFARSLVAVRDPRSGALALERDELPRPDTSAAGLAALAPSFAALGATAAGPNGETLDELAPRVDPGAQASRPLPNAGTPLG